MTTPRYGKWMIALTAALLIATGSPRDAHAAEPGNTPTAPATIKPPGASAPATVTEQEAGAVTPKPDRLRRTWWNAPRIVETLQLKDPLRSQMDKLLDHALEDLRTSQSKQTEQRKAFEAALAKGDWKAARTAATDLRETMTASAGAQMNLKIDALTLLDATQRQTFFSKYSHLLQRPWGINTPMGRRLMRPGMM